MSKFDDAVARMRNWLENPLSKIEGTFSMFNIRAVAKESAQIQNEMDIIEDNYSLDTAKGEYLDIKGRDYGMYRHYGQKAHGEVTFTGTVGSTIPGGTVLIASEYGVQFQTLNSIVVGSDGTVTTGIEALAVGPSYNVPAGAINQIAQQIQGVSGVTNAAAFTGGTDREDDDNFRMRIYFKIRYPATSGNVYHYQQWATEVNGVGAVKIFPLWNGPGTVKVSVLDANGDPASEELMQNVEDHIDPEPKQHGGGEAPVGALVTVSTATAKEIHVSAKVQLGQTAGDIGSVQEAFREALSDYFHSVSYDGETVSISLARVGNILFGVPGVIDYTGLTINSGTDSVPIGEEEVPAVGTVTLTLPDGGGGA